MELGMWLAFLATVAVIALSPGPGAVLSMATGLRAGVVAAWCAIAGLEAALMLQLAVVVAGVGALLATSQTAFGALKLAGAAYLVWLGVQRWRAKPLPLVTEAPAAPDEMPLRLFIQGLLVNLTNPKAIIFIAALVPQFLDASRPQGLQVAEIALTTVVVDVTAMTGYALLASRFRPLLKSSRFMLLQNRVFGSIFILAGAALAGARR